APDGRVLVTHDVEQAGVIARGPDGQDRELAWLDWSLIADISADGRTILFTETGEGGGPGYSVYVRAVDGSPAVRLGEGHALRFSPDGKQVLAQIHPTTEQRLVVYPTGTGEAKVLNVGGLKSRNAIWMPDGQHIVMDASAEGQDSRIYILDTRGGAPRAVAPSGFGLIDISPDGRRLIVRGPDRKFSLMAIAGGEAREVPGLEGGDLVALWGPDAHWIYVQKGFGPPPTRIVRHELETGRQEPWRDLIPSDAVGVKAVYWLRLSRDGTSQAYGYSRKLSTLYLVEGLR
ncbi:MAG: hypothetical protein ABI968_14795, partial [Acidobacteriota bacterium]